MSTASTPRPYGSCLGAVNEVLLLYQPVDGIDAIDPDLTLKGLAILHAEVSGGEPLELGLAR